MYFILLLYSSCFFFFFFFFFNDTATTEIYTLSLHDALPIFFQSIWPHQRNCGGAPRSIHRSEEHTSELQSQSNLVCRLLLEKKKKKQQKHQDEKKKKNKKNKKNQQKNK